MPPRDRRLPAADPERPRAVLERAEEIGQLADEAEARLGVSPTPDDGSG